MGYAGGLGRITSFFATKRTICGIVCDGGTKMTDKFFQRYEMNVQPSRRKLRRANRDLFKTNAWNVAISDEMLYQNFAIEEVECVDVVMPKDRLKELEEILEWYEEYDHKIKHSISISEQLMEDKRVRIENPAVAKAYQKYITLLELARK